MADHADDHDIFVYMGGQVPEHLREIITHARIDESITVIDIMAFDGCPRLLHVDFHDGVERVGSWAFRNCSSLRRLHLPGVRIIGGGAFGDCVTLEDVEIGDKLETIGNGAFWRCTSLRHLKIPSIRTIEVYAFLSCTSLTDAEFGKGLETLECRAFSLCRSLRRIALPLKYGMFSFDHEADRYNQFNGCHDLAAVEIVGGGEIHNIVSYLSLQSWRNEMNQEINRINQILPHSPTTEKARLIREWIQSVLDRIEHYKAEHHNLLKEATTLLELALWKAKLRQKKEEEDSLDTTKAKKAKIDVQSVRQEKRITSGADIIVKNVLPFLELP